MDTICPTIQEIYDWDFKQLDPHTISITIKYPKEFNVNMLEFELSDYSSVFKASIKGNAVPVIYGELMEPIIRYSTEIDKEKQTVTLLFTKNTETNWKYLIKDFVPNTHDIDPHSAFIIVNEDPGFDDDKLSDLLAISMQRGYLPAILFGIEELTDEKDSEKEYLVLLDVACRVYRSPVAAFKLGVFYLSHNEEDKGYIYLSQAAKAGIGMAYSLMGQCLSPESGIKFSHKNAQQAIAILEKVIEKKDEPVALFEAAQIYNVGAEGVPKDETKAMDYWKRAKAVDATLPPLKKKNKLLIGAGITAGLAFVTYSIYSIFKKE